MSVLSRYLNQLYFKSVMATTFVILAFAMLFDLLDVSDDLLSGEGSALAAFGRYFLLRTPSLLSEILPIAALLAGLFTASGLLRSSEMVVVWASGVSILAVIGRLLPVCALLMVAKFAIDDLLVPKSIEGLRNWGVGNFSQAKLGVGGDFVWFRQEGRIFRLPLAANRGPTLFELGEDGNLTARLDIQEVEYGDKQWTLRQITKQSRGRRELIEEIVLPAPISPGKLDRLYRPPQELSFLELTDVILNDGYGAIATERHRTWLYQRLVGALVPPLLGCLAFALARRFDRRQGAGLLFLKGIGIGFGFIILNGIAVALGESGFLSPATGSFVPILLLAAIVLIGPIRQHRRGAAS